jgi:transposase InsO family protein
MSVHDAVFEYRSRLVGVIEASPNRRVACREAGIHPSTFYRWRRRPEPVSPYQGLSMADRLVEQRIIAETLAYPALGPRPLADGLGDSGVTVSASKVWRTQVKHRLNTRRLRYALLAQHREPVGFVQTVARPQRFIGELDATLPGDLIQMDCFHVGSFKETRLKAGKAQRGVIWQYTAIDVASSWTWAELHATTHNPSPALTSALAHRVAADLTTFGWTPQAISTDNGNEFRAQLFRDTLESLGIEHRFIKAGRPQSNGKVERVQRTILEECYQPALIGYVEPSITGLRQDLDTYIEYYNHQRRHYGKWNNGKTPAQIMITLKTKHKP